MLADTQTHARLVQHWLGQLDIALREADETRLAALFHPDCHWRDVLALTWRIQTVNGRDTICAALKAHANRVRPREGLGLARRTAPCRTEPGRMVAG